MRVSPWLLALIAPALFGCAGGKHAVYVDLDSIARDEVVPTQKSVAPPGPQPGMSEMNFSLPGQPAKVVRDSGDAIKISIAQIEKAQRDAAHVMDIRLRALYQSESARFARERLSKFEGARTAAYDSANSAIQKAFAEYGAKRGPLMAGLAIDVGWPDPNPTSKGDQAAMNIVQKKIYLKDKDLRAKIAEVDREYSAILSKQFAAAEAQSAKVLAQIQGAINEFRNELNKKADAEAAREVRATPKDLDIRLAGARTFVLPAVPTRSVRIAGVEPMPPAPRVPLNGFGNGPEDRRRLVEQELQSWLGLNRLTLAKPGKGVPDKTAEFRAWRKNLLSDGP